MLGSYHLDHEMFSRLVTPLRHQHDNRHLHLNMFASEKVLHNCTVMGIQNHDEQTT
jgi:hypothetical protein